MTKETISNLKSTGLHFSTVFITGATSGMGFELALRFLATGQRKVIAIGRNESKLEELQLLGALTQKLDLSLSEDIQKALELMNIHKPDLVYHAAGSTEYGRLSERNAENVSAELKLHMESTLKLLHSFGNLPKGKRIFVGFSSALAYTPAPGMSLYSSCKQAISTLCKLCDIEYQDKGFRVLCSLPGPILTAFHTRASWGMYREKSPWSMMPEKAVDWILWQTKYEISSLPLGPLAWLAWISSKCLPFSFMAKTLYREILKRAAKK